MPYTGDPLNNPVDRIRLSVGDTDVYEEGLNDDVYLYVLGKNTVDGVTNEGLTAVECLRYLLAKYANYVTEKAGGLFVKESEKFEQYQQLLDKFTKDPSYSLLKAGMPYAGGISKSDAVENAQNPDARLVEYKETSDPPTFIPTSFRGQRY